MATPPKFSVVIPTYGRPALLSEAVESVLGQTMDDLECIVVDDGSPEVVTVGAHPRVTLVRHDRNRGLPAARNTGLARATGEYVTFLDDDDLMTPDRLQLALTGLAHAPLAICWTRYLDSSGETGWTRRLEGDVSNVLLEHLTPHVGQAAMRREVALPFDERFPAAEEIDWWIRMSQHVRVTTIPEVGYLFRRHDLPRHSNTFSARVRDRELVLDAHADYFRTRPLATAFQWKRIGLTALRAGDRRAARRAFAQSLRHNPQPRTAWHLARACVPGR